ncbi:unnamed protein product [Staurois parvus]|uniref:Uncharacterized protein n=1 Tax=Staurois parvus TaxID=386267 RepID=A0ABN9BLP9_9NEOB|nr:unnamed protein product [Staurois parvus]
MAPHVNSFLPSAISTVLELFIISTDHCIGVTGDVSDTKSVPPPQCQNARHSPAISR